MQTMTTPPPTTTNRRAAARRMVAAGALSLVTGVLLLVSPMLLGRGTLIKYILAVGFLGTCLGIILLLLGSIDWWRGSRP